MKKILIALILITVLMMVFPVPVYAIDDPDSAPQVNAVFVYEDLLEDGDAGMWVDFYLDYSIAGNPDETVTEAYLVIFIDTDGTTQLKAVAPYAYYDDGYGRNGAWIYFSAAEVDTYSIDSADIALYTVWLVGNPTLAWAGDPPKTIAGIDYWQPSGSDTSVLFALRVLYYAQIFEDAWTGEDLIEATSLGSRLTADGEEYFTNAIQNLRQIAPAAFASSEYLPTMNQPDYDTVFGATMADGTGTVAGSPITLTEGANTVNVTAAGTFTLELEHGTAGTVVDGTGTVTGSPVAIVEGENTITVPGGGTGTLTVTVNLVNTASYIDDTVTGTGLDLTTIAALCGMSRWMFSGLLWFVLSVCVCAAVYRVPKSSPYTASVNRGKLAMLIFCLCIIGGTILGLVHILVATMMFICFGAFTGYVIFFKGANP